MTGQQPLSDLSPPTSTVPSRYYGWMLAVLCSLAFIYMEWLALRQWASGHWYMADVGNIQQCLVNTLHGNFMWSPLDQGRFFAFHFSPFLLLLAPFTLLSAYPIPLVSGYVLALALTPIPIYAIARNLKLSGGVGLAAGAWFLANHFTGSLQLANHFESWYVLFALSLIAVFPRAGKTGYLWIIFAILALSVKEDAAVWLAGFALWHLVFQRESGFQKRSIMLLVICVFWAILAAGVMYSFASSSHSNAGKYIQRMEGISLTGDNALTWLTLLASAAFLPILSGRALLLLLVPLPVILGNYSFTRSLLYYYSYPFLPFLAFAALMGAANFRKFMQGRIPKLSPDAPVIALLLIVAIIQFALPTRTDEQKRLPMTVMPLNTSQRQFIASKLPSDVPVAIQFSLWGFVPSRPDAVSLQADQILDRHYLVFQRQGQFGLVKDDLTKLSDLLTSDTETGRRRELHSGSGIVILSPAEKEPYHQ